MDSNTLIDETTGPVHLIRPAAIDCKRRFIDSFGNTETEASAWWIVKLCQTVEGWKPFTREEMEVFYREAERYNYTFNKLLDQGMVVLGEDGKYRVTHLFITRCYGASPAA